MALGTDGTPHCRILRSMPLLLAHNSTACITRKTFEKARELSRSMARAMLSIRRYMRLKA